MMKIKMGNDLYQVFLLREIIILKYFDDKNHHMD